MALGATAVDGLLGKTLGITKLRGTWKTYRGTADADVSSGVLLRNQAMSEKRKVWEDMLAVMERTRNAPSAKSSGIIFLKDKTYRIVKRTTWASISARRRARLSSFAITFLRRFPARSQRQE